MKQINKKYQGYTNTNTNESMQYTVNKNYPNVSSRHMQLCITVYASVLQPSRVCVFDDDDVT